MTEWLSTFGDSRPEPTPVARQRAPKARRWMGACCLTAALLAAAVSFAPDAALAKEFGPGELRLCGAQRCVPITDRGVLHALSTFYYSGAPPAIARAPRLGMPAYELRFGNDYVTGIVATADLDRFLSYGVNLGRFNRGVWYRLPSLAARALRRLSAPLTPLRVTVATERQSR